MTDELDIPASAYEPKPWWDRRPSDERIQEVLGFILRTGKPYLWPGQTYDRPLNDSHIEYLAEFCLPSNRPLVPCPCCTPRHPKYRRGMIAYFPEEKTIRIMGHDCFKSINAHGHTEALRKYHAELQRKKDVIYLLENLDNVPELISIIEHAAPVGHAVDEFRNNACKVFREALHIDLWEHIRTGQLRIARIRTQVIQIPGRGEETRDIEIVETYGTITGQDFLKARSPRLGLKLDNALVALRQIDFGPKFNERVAQMTDSDRRQTASLLGRALKTANEVFALIDELRQFTSPATIATLNGWARIAECPIHMRLAFDGSSLHVGKREHDYRRIEVPAPYLVVLKRLPTIRVKSDVA